MASPDKPSAKLIARREAKIVYNKAAIDALYAGMADGLIELGEAIIADASERAPKDTGDMSRTGYVTVFGQGKLVHGSGQVAAAKNRPRGVKVPKDQVVMIAAFASPLAHLQELGTVKMAAHPFLAPALMANVRDAGPYVSGAMSRYAATASKRADNGAMIAALRATAKAGGQ